MKHLHVPRTAQLFSSILTSPRHFSVILFVDVRLSVRHLILLSLFPCQKLSHFPTQTFIMRMMDRVLKTLRGFITVSDTVQMTNNSRQNPISYQNHQDEKLFMVCASYPRSTPILSTAGLDGQEQLSKKLLESEQRSLQEKKGRVVTGDPDFRKTGDAILLCK